VSKGTGSDIRAKLKNMSLRDYIGSDNFRYNVESPSSGSGGGGPLSYKKDGEQIYNMIL
jgi:hypothetical protein